MGLAKVTPQPGATDERGVIHGTRDGGATWTRQWLAPYHNYQLLDVEVVDATTAWAVGRQSASGAGPILLVTHDGGATWEGRAAGGVEMGLAAIDFVDSSYGWAVGDGGEIVHTEDGGATRSLQQGPESYALPWLSDLSFVDREHGWTVGTMVATGSADGWILHTTTGGH